MSDQQQRIRDLLRAPLEAVISPRQQARLATISSAFDRTGRIKPETIGAALTIPIALDIAGALAIGTDIGPRRRVTQAVRVWQVWADVETAPSGGECTLWIASNGVRIASVTIQPGETSNVSSASADIDPGALLTLDCTAANGAADASVMIATRPRGA